MNYSLQPWPPDDAHETAAGQAHLDPRSARAPSSGTGSSPVKGAIHQQAPRKPARPEDRSAGMTPAQRPLRHSKPAPQALEQQTQASLGKA